MSPTTVDAPAGGADLDLGSVLSDAYDSAVAETGAQPSDGAGEPGSIPEEPDSLLGSLDEPEPEPGQAPQTAKPADTAKPGDQPPPAEGQYKLTEDGKGYIVPKAELPSLQAARDYQKAISQYFPDATSAQNAHLQASDLRAMQNDWAYGTPEAIQGVLNHWAGLNHQDPQARQRFQASFARMSERIPDMLKSMNPSAYEGMVQGMLGRAISAAYGRAATTGAPEDFKKAQELDWGVTGTYKTELPKVDPQAARLAQLENEQRAFNDRQAVALRRDVGAFNNEVVEGAKFTQLSSMIDKILGPVKDRYGEVAYGDLREGIKRELIDTVRRNPEWWREHEQTWQQLMEDYRALWKQGASPTVLEPRIKSYISSFLSQAKRELPAIAQKRVNATTAARLPRGTNGKFVSPSAAAPPSPTQNGSPRSASATNGRPSAEQWDKEWNAVFAPFKS